MNPVHFNFTCTVLAEGTQSQEESSVLINQIWKFSSVDNQQLWWIYMDAYLNTTISLYSEVDNHKHTDIFMKPGFYLFC